MGCGVDDLEDTTQRLQLFGAHCEPRPLATFFAFEQTGFDQHFEMVTDRWLRATKRSGQITSACFAAPRNQVHEPQPNRVRQCLEHDHDLFGLGFAQRRIIETRTAQRPQRRFLNGCIEYVSHRASLPQKLRIDISGNYQVMTRKSDKETQRKMNPKSSPMMEHHDLRWIGKATDVEEKAKRWRTAIACGAGSRTGEAGGAATRRRSQEEWQHDARGCEASYRSKGAMRAGAEQQPALEPGRA